MHAFRSYIFAARNACDSGPTCDILLCTRKYTDWTRLQLFASVPANCLFPPSIFMAVFGSEWLMWIDE